MQAIQTKWIPFTQTKPSRIIAKCGRGRIIVSEPIGVSSYSDEMHVFAAKELIKKFVAEDASHEKHPTPPNENPWNKPFVTGELTDRTRVHVFIH